VQRTRTSSVLKHAKKAGLSRPGVAVVQNDWFGEGSEIRLRVDPDRANLAGITNSDVANSAMAGINGFPVTTLRTGNKEVPVIARLHPDERASLADVEHLYVYSTGGEQKVPLLSVASIQATLETERIVRQEHFRMISVDCYPHPGVLASDVLQQALPQLERFGQALPAGFHVQLSGEDAKRREGFTELAMVLLTSLLGIYFTLLLQFSNPIKPLLVLAAAPYGVVGALVGLAITRTPFGFMAFFGIVSLIGVIVSHVIVLFDCIEEMHERGEPLDSAIIIAGVTRLRPVLITVGATVLALFPLAWHGGPLWLPLCYAQIGGLLAATFVTLLLVPALYGVFVLDLHLIDWRHEHVEAANQLAADVRID
jgi:multidrug efflux pump subunit AcrB